MDNNNGKCWYRILPDVEFAMNNVKSKTTGKCSSILLFGCKQRGKIIDKLADYMHDSNTVNDRNLDTIRAKIASAKIEQTQRQSEKHVGKKRKPAHAYQIGDLILIRNFNNTVGVSKKLIPQFKGPYKITKCLRNNRYIIADINGFQYYVRWRG